MGEKAMPKKTFSKKKGKDKTMKRSSSKSHVVSPKEASQVAPGKDKKGGSIPAWMTSKNKTTPKKVKKTAKGMAGKKGK